MISLLKPCRFCRNITGPLLSSLMAIAVASMTGENTTMPMRLKMMSKARLATESQSLIGLSKISSIGTEPM